MYTTYYIASSGQPVNHWQTHADFAAALDAWLANCGAVQLRSGGCSRLIDVDTGEDLTWTEGHPGGYISGTLADPWLGEDATDLASPAAVAVMLRHYVGATMPKIKTAAADLRPEIRRRMAACGMTIRELAARIGANEHSLARTLRRGPSPAERVLARCLAALPPDPGSPAPGS
jgi:lambda repressor-like predicted transcriptional regulator